MQQVSFSQLPTEQLRKRMRPHAIEIYQMVFGSCEIEDLREGGLKVHILDKEFGIDSIVNLASGQYLTLQEKYRDNTVLPMLKRWHLAPEFTQEHKNAYGTPYEHDGEWFHLAAHVYFYGWANADYSGFEKWFIMDVAKYKMLVEEAGGLDRMGTHKTNKKHGRASFYAIPVQRLQSAIIVDYRKFLSKKRHHR